MKPLPVMDNVPKNLILNRSWVPEKNLLLLFAITLPKEHDNKMSSNDIKLDSRISDLFSHHWREFFQQQMETDAETQSQKSCGKRV